MDTAKGREERERKRERERERERKGFSAALMVSRPVLTMGATNCKRRTGERNGK
jgi:hypothetical protein